MRKFRHIKWKRKEPGLYDSACRQYQIKRETQTWKGWEVWLRPHEPTRDRLRLLPYMTLEGAKDAAERHAKKYGLQGIGDKEEALEWFRVESGRYRSNLFWYEGQCCVYRIHKTYSGWKSVFYNGPLERHIAHPFPTLREAKAACRKHHRLLPKT